jgi:phosphoribosylformylglycinamidine (FGAM) synthase-like enzyme
MKGGKGGCCFNNSIGRERINCGSKYFYNSLQNKKIMEVYGNENAQTDG